LLFPCPFYRCEHLPSDTIQTLSRESSHQHSAPPRPDSSIEYTDRTGLRISALTQVLVKILRDALQSDISWQSVSLCLRDKMALTMPEQHPDIAGPVARLLFSLDERQASMHLVKFYPYGPPMLQAGRLHGVEEGNVCALLSYGTEILDKNKKVATATVIRITSVEAELSVDKAYGSNQDVVAFLKNKALKRWPISFNGVPTFRDSMGEYIQIFSPGLRIADRDEEHLASVTMTARTSQSAMRQSWKLADGHITWKTASTRVFPK